jgi:hypothetical protein
MLNLLRFFRPLTVECLTPRKKNYLSSGTQSNDVSSEDFRVHRINPHRGNKEKVEQKLQKGYDNYYDYNNYDYVE